MVKPEFFDKNAVSVAKKLIGKYLCRRVSNSKVQEFKITETEAYEGMEDRASHASRGKTARNEPMFGKPGTLYIYFTYGMHWMLNIVCGPKDHPAAVLIRGIEEIKKRKDGKMERLNGPGKLTKYLGVDKKLNGKMLGKKSGLWIEGDLKMEKRKEEKIIKTPRVGVDYAGPVWANKKYRFLLKN